MSGQTTTLFSQCENCSQKLNNFYNGSDKRRNGVGFPFRCGWRRFRVAFSPPEHGSKSGSEDIAFGCGVHAASAFHPTSPNTSLNRVALLPEVDEHRCASLE
jgi:hypothetical protein